MQEGEGREERRNAGEKVKCKEREERKGEKRNRGGGYLHIPASSIGSASTN